MAGGMKLSQTGSDLLRTVIWAACGLVLAWVATSTADKIEALTQEMGNLNVSIVKLEGKVDGLPPPELTYRITVMESRISKLETRHE
jgi:hypothetical protein